MQNKFFDIALKSAARLAGKNGRIALLVGKLGYKITKKGKPRKQNASPIYKRKYSEATIKAVLRAGIKEHEATGLPLRQCVGRAEKSYGVTVNYAWRRWISGLEEI